MSRLNQPRPCFPPHDRINAAARHTISLSNLLFGEGRAEGPYLNHLIAIKNRAPASLATVMRPVQQFIGHVFFGRSPSQMAGIHAPFVAAAMRHLGSIARGRSMNGFADNPMGEAPRALNIENPIPARERTKRPLQAFVIFRVKMLHHPLFNFLRIGFRAHATSFYPSRFRVAISPPTHPVSLTKTLCAASGVMRVPLAARNRTWCESVSHSSLLTGSFRLGLATVLPTPRQPAIYGRFLPKIQGIAL